MLPYTRTIDPAGLTMFDLSAETDHCSSDGTSRVTECVPKPTTTYGYKLQDRALWHSKFDSSGFTLATRSAGSIVASFVENRYATEVSVHGEESALFCFSTLLHGEMTLIDRGHETRGTASCGFALRAGPSTRLVM